MIGARNGPLLLALTADGRPAGTAAAHSFELTLPGETLVPVSGVTAVGVLPSHRDAARSAR